jgi:restriction system protein
MTIPDYQTIMLPLLRTVADIKEHSNSELINGLSKEFNLSVKEKDELLPSGRETAFGNKVRWARFYLLHAGLVESKKRGSVNITKRGIDALAKNPTKMDVKSLFQYADFAKYMKTLVKQKGEGKVEIANEQTPEALIEDSYQKIRNELSQQLLIQVKNATPNFFEKLVVELLVNMGYGGSLRDAGQVIGKSGDEGIDGTIKEDRLGLDTIYIQAKRWADTPVGRKDLQAFVGALKGQRANKGVFITTSRFSNDAVDYVRKIDSKIVLVACLP